MKPLAYVYPQDSTTFSLWDEYIFGNTFLVAPVFSPETSRKIYLPEGRWIDFNDLNTEFHGPLTITQNVALEIIPVFVKDNSIYISGNIYQGNARLWQKDHPATADITIHLFPGGINDSVTFNYIDYLDNDIEKTMILNHLQDKITFSSGPLTTGVILDIKCLTKPSQVLLNSIAVKYAYDKTKKIARIRAMKNKSINLEIR